ncbi:hypothetical protein [uncultured Clostridium sp.]|uniref:hypothetical protein n=1 Tax=uncultured Clostridium sp. TaxID=59620 RepID=UPI0025F9AF38|nr:hypothetical protein [uncultured Clostridium sp.]
MANIFDGIHKMDIEELQYLLATLETMTVSNISSEIGQKAKKSVVKAVNFVNDFFNKKKIDEPAVISMEQRLKDNKKKLEILSRQQLEKRFRSTIVSKLKILGENITEADSDDVISVCIIDNAAKSYKKEISEDLTPAKKADGIFFRYNEKLLSQTKEKLKNETAEEREKTDKAIQQQINKMGDDQQKELKKALGLENLTGQEVRKMLSAAVGTSAGILVVNASGFGAYMALTTIMHAIFTTTLGITLPFAAYTGATSALAFITGPAGWLALIGVEAFMLNRSKNKIIYELFAQTVWISVHSYGSNFTPKNEELPSWLPKVEREKAEEESEAFLNLYRENEKLKDEYNLLKTNIKKKEESIKTYIENISQLNLHIKEAEKKKDKQNKEKFNLEQKYKEIENKYRCVKYELNIKDNEFKQLSYEEQEKYENVKSEFENAKRQLKIKNNDIKELYDIIDDSENEIKLKEKEIKNLKEKLDRDNIEIVNLNNQYEEENNKFLMQLNKNAADLEIRWKVVFKRFIFDNNVIKSVVKNFQYNELGNIEAVLMEMHTTDNPMALSSNRGKVSDGRAHIGFSTPSGFPCRIFYRANKDKSNGKSIIISEIVKHNDSRYCK